MYTRMVKTGTHLAYLSQAKLLRHVVGTLLYNRLQRLLPPFPLFRGSRLVQCLKPWKVVDQSPFDRGPPVEPNLSCCLLLSSLSVIGNVPIFRHARPFTGWIVSYRR